MIKQNKKTTYLQQTSNYSIQFNSIDDTQLWFPKRIKQITQKRFKDYEALKNTGNLKQFPAKSKAEKKKKKKGQNP